jgi:hypothetical protein
VKKVVKCREIVVAGSGAKGAPYIALMSWRMELERVEPAECGPPVFKVGGGERGSNELEVGLGARVGVAP